MTKFAFRFQRQWRQGGGHAVLWAFVIGVGLQPSTVEAQNRIRPRSKTDVAIPAPVRASPGLGVVKPVEDARVAAVDTVKNARTVLIDQFRHELTTPQSAFDNKQLTVEDILQILASGQRLAYGESNEELESEMAGLLVQHAPEQVKEARKLPLLTRTALGRYYSSIGDIRTVAIAEQLLEELDRKPQDVEPWPQLWGVIFLSRYYEKSEQWQKAAETWERGTKYWPDTAWWQASMQIETARGYIEIGNEAKGKENYQKAIVSNDEAESDLAFQEYSSFLIQQDETQEAQQLLEEGIKLSKAARNPRKTIASTLLSSLHYTKGETEKAKKYSKMALDYYAVIKDESQRESLKKLADKAEKIGQFIEQWERQPLVCDPAAITLSVIREADENLIVRRFIVSSFRSVELQISTNNPLLKARIEESPWAQDALPMEFQKMVVLEVSTAALLEDFKAVLTLSSPQLSNFKIRVPFSVDLH